MEPLSGGRGLARGRGSKGRGFGGGRGLRPVGGRGFGGGRGHGAAQRHIGANGSGHKKLLFGGGGGILGRFGPF